MVSQFNKSHPNKGIYPKTPRSGKYAKRPFLETWMVCPSPNSFCMVCAYHPPQKKWMHPRRYGTALSLFCTECGVCRFVTYSAVKARTEDFCKEPFYFGHFEEDLSSRLDD
ncbi:hypothetical protein CEXT_281561 [Caerostris extrusa]|uniref:Uncharacterized protein n=1 Tax=Caerostris extrusa TaxID=172846 RepID=A0AAV4YD78_CAEEX|nr:hypothetical protein CEXT_281561 [Caerostris extrusa]